MASVDLFSLGKIFPSDFLKPDEQPRCEPVELKLVMDDNGLVHLSESAPESAMYGERYWYRSGINKSMQDELKDVVDSIFKVYKAKPGAVFLDIASNDGTLLINVPEEMITVGIDPVGGEIKAEAIKHADDIIQDFFSEKVYKESKYGYKKVSICTIISMFYDVLNPKLFLHELNSIMEDDGLLVMQLSYTPLMLQQLEFSNICHEHLFYYNLLNIESLLNETRFKLMDVQLNNTNAGSFRLYIMKEKGNETKFGTQTHRDVCEFRKRSLRHYEARMSYNDSAKWFGFFDKVNDLKERTVDFINDEVSKGKIIYGYGASTKFNTVLQYFGINNKMLVSIADRSLAKHGLRTVGTNIPIVSEEVMRAAKPDYLLVGPAHFISEFMERERALLKSGTKFIVTMPSFRIITKDDL
jgi:hypothetical protein